MNNLLMFVIGSVLTRAFIDLFLHNEPYWFIWGLLVGGATIARLVMA